MKKLLFILLCLGISGCAGISLRGSPDSLKQKDEEIKRLKTLLSAKETQLEKKDAQIEDLRKKLEAFGVFE
jgi:peptidoglycan hydrolase CwlO-like protein